MHGFVVFTAFLARTVTQNLIQSHTTLQDEEKNLTVLVF